MQAVASRPPCSAGLEASHRYCHLQTRRNARSFYFSSFALPKEKKRAAYAVYAFCRYADDLVDRAESGADVQAVLARVGREFDAMVAVEIDGPPFAPAFAWAVKRYGIEKGLFLDLLQGVATDLEPVRIADWLELRGYCYGVASVVGLMMASIFELRAADRERGIEAAVDLGIAMQLTNIVRDVGEDHRMGRIYLPADAMERNGIASADLGREWVTDDLRGLLRALVRLARRHYRRAEKGIPLLADDGSQSTVWLMRHVYAGILDEVEKMNFEILQRRAKTTFPRKLLLAFHAWRDYRRTRHRGNG